MDTDLRAAAHPPADAGPAVAVIGNLCIDLVFDGLASLPAWGEEVMARGHRAGPAGQGFHVATAMARMGHDCRLVGIVGNDKAGAEVREALAGANVDVGAVAVVPDGKTATTVALVRPDGERAFVSDFACQMQFGRAQIERVWDALGNAAGVALVGLFNMPGLSVRDAAGLLERARSSGRLTAFDPGWDPGGWGDTRVEETLAALASVDVFLPNLDEARALTGESAPERAARALAAHAPGKIVIKCGREGAMCVSDGEIHLVGALDVEAVDAVGAGDTFDAAFLAAELRGLPVRQSLAIASGAAGLFVSRAADRRPTMDEAHRAAQQLA